MNKDIMHLSNELVYGGQLRSANEVVANQRLNLHIGAENSKSFSEEYKWVKDIITSESGVLLIDVDGFNNWRNVDPVIMKMQEEKIRTESFKKRSISPLSKQKPIS